MMMKSKALLALAAAITLGISACSAGTDEPSTVVVQPNDPLATLTVRWSLSGSTDPNACAQSVADVIDISIVDPGTGGEIQAFQQTCETFQTSITLAPGTYAARARLLDSAGTARTTDVTVPTFTLYGNDELVQDVDFPSDSFR